jgi:hypothetical protein
MQHSIILISIPSSFDRGRNLRLRRRLPLLANNAHEYSTLPCTALAGNSYILRSLRGPPASDPPCLHTCILSHRVRTEQHSCNKVTCSHWRQRMTKTHPIHSQPTFAYLGIFDTALNSKVSRGRYKSSTAPTLPVPGGCQSQVTVPVPVPVLWFTSTDWAFNDTEYSYGDLEGQGGCVRKQQRKAKTSHPTFHPVHSTPLHSAPSLPSFPCSILYVGNI